MGIVGIFVGKVGIQSLQKKIIEFGQERFSTGKEDTEEENIEEGNKGKASRKASDEVSQPKSQGEKSEKEGKEDKVEQKQAVEQEGSGGGGFFYGLEAEELATGF
jgi:hypothetical protein